MRDTGRNYVYQQVRILTFIDPSTDPLGAGYHTTQASIAIGSGGVVGKGWLNGTQAHLDFLPEKHTDFIFAVFGEEFGLIGNVLLVILYLVLIARDKTLRFLRQCQGYNDLLKGGSLDTNGVLQAGDTILVP